MGMLLSRHENYRNAFSTTSADVAPESAPEPVEETAPETEPETSETEETPKE